MYSMTKLTIVTLAVLFFASISVTVNAQPAPAPSNPSTKTDMGAVAKGLGDDALKLKEKADQAFKKLGDLQTQLDKDQQNTQLAAKTVDELLSLLHTDDDLLSPDGEYARTLTAEEAIVRNYANRAAASTDPEIRKMAGWFKDRADEIASLRVEAEKLRTRFKADIDRLDQQKERLEFAVVAAQITKFLQNAHEYIDTLKGMAADTKDLADKVGNAFGTSQPTQ
jgi:uncharacterized protein YukE